MGDRTTTDVAIIGGGIVGASAAFALRRLGIAVTLLERDVCGAKASGVNFGGVRRQGRPLSQLPLAQRAHGIWSRLQALIGIDGEYVQSGHLKLARSDADLASLEAYRAQTLDFGLELQLLSRADIHARYPWLGDGVAGGSLCPADGQANPRLVSPAFASAAHRLGARIVEHAPVDCVEHDGDRFVLRAPGLELKAPVLINCAGAWANAVAAQFGEEVPMVSANPGMLVTEPLAPLLNVNIGVEGGGVYARQVRRGNFVIGGARAQALDGERSRVGPAAVAAIVQQAVEIVPRLRQAWIIRTWSGTEGFLPDRLPVLGPSATTAGLFHAFGFAGAGFQIGPAVGEVLADLVRDGRSTTPIDAFSISRFSAAHPKET
ncbi:MAG: FAD-binding oxidoreductase [Rubrivivax sp.]